MAPVYYNRTNIKERNQFTLKLANLPFGITVFDLKDLLEQTNAQTCFIPRTRDKYTRQRFAFINFKNEEDINKVLTGNDQFCIKDCPLVWVPAEHKTCHKCGNPEHMVKDYNERQESLDRRQKKAQFSKVYTKYRVPNYRKYNNDYHRYRNDRNRDRNDEQITSKTNNNQKTPEYDNNQLSEQTMLQILREIKNDISELKKEVNIVKDKIKTLENPKGKAKQLDSTNNNNNIEQEIINNTNNFDNNPDSRYNNKRWNYSRYNNRNFNDNNKRYIQRNEERSSFSSSFKSDDHRNKKRNIETENDDTDNNTNLLNIKQDQQKQDEKINNIDSKLDMLMNFFNQNNQNASGSSTSKRVSFSNDRQ